MREGRTSDQLLDVRHKLGTFLEGISWEGIIREGYFGILNGCPFSKKTGSNLLPVAFHKPG